MIIVARDERPAHGAAACGARDGRLPARRSPCSSSGRPTRRAIPSRTGPPGGLVVLALLAIAAVALRCSRPRPPGDRVRSRSARWPPTRRSATSRSPGPHRRATRSKGPTGRCSTCSCSPCSRGGRSAASTAAALLVVWTLCLAGLALYVLLAPRRRLGRDALAARSPAVGSTSRAAIRTPTRPSG